MDGMNTTDHQEHGQTESSAAERVNRALTVGGYVTSSDGTYRDSTAKLYAAAWKAFAEWCRSNGLSSLPATAETVAVYSAALLDDGYTPDTVRGRVTAIRAQHRMYGHPVPDNVAAWIVIRGGVNRRARPVVNGINRTDLLAALESCPSTNLGIRNRALVLLIWDMFPVPDIIKVNIGDVDDPGKDNPMMIRGLDHPVEHDHTDPGACPPCAVRAWVRALRKSQITTGALFRPVDRIGHIAAAGIRRCGNMAPDARLSTRSVHRAWARVVADARIPWSTPRSLRLGGAKDRADKGKPAIDVIDRSEWSQDPRTVTNRVLAG